MGCHRAWMGVVGVCALLSACKEREAPEPQAPAAARAPAPARPGVSAPQEQVSAAPMADTGEQQPMAPAPPEAPAQGVPEADAAAPGMAPGQPLATELGTPQQAPEGRVMIGMEAVQAREDEPWYEGAAKAARAARENEEVPLEKVVIATGTVEGRVARVDRGMLHVRDGEGNLYELRIDPQSRGMREGQPVPLRQLEEGTPVRASFDLVGDSSIARDVEVRR